jgi:hypothetical protein
VGCAFLLDRLKDRIGANWLVVLGEAGTAITLFLLGLAREPIVAICASLIAGASWIAVVATLNMSAQLALPDWVRGRGLAMYVTVFFRNNGSVLWGEMAELTGLPLTHFIAGAGALLAIPLTQHWKLQTGAGIDLSPSMHWPEPIVVGALESDAGPVLVTVEYRIDPANRDRLLTALQALARERKRDGAYA